MKKMKKKRVVFFLALVLALAYSGCSRTKPGEAAGDGGAIIGSTKTGPAWPVFALLETGVNPLWFEFSPSGLNHLRSPSESSLTAYTPWPFARYAAGMLVHRGNLALAINREGFIAVSPGSKPGDITLYSSPDRTGWGPFSVSSVFMYEGRPSALLCREDFFAEPPASGPEYPVYVLDEGRTLPLGKRFPALEVLPKEAGWEADAVHLGTDGFWYCRFSQPGRPAPGKAYYAMADFAAEGEAVSAGAYRSSFAPEAPPADMPLIASLIETVAENTGEHFTLAMISPDFSGSRVFSGSLSPDGDFIELFGYYDSGKNPGGGSDPIALGALPSGNGFFTDGKRAGVFELPPLPEGFVYTALGLVGNALTASWEERDEFSIGAAGIVVVSASIAGQ